MTINYGIFETRNEEFYLAWNDEGVAGQALQATLAPRTTYFDEVYFVDDGMLYAAGWTSPRDGDLSDFPTKLEP